MALRVDELSAERSDVAANQTTLPNYPFEIGTANEPLLQKLQLVNDYLFLFQDPFPVPMSFLIDDEFRLASIYRGRLSLERLRDDLANLKSSPEVRRARSVPFAGRWIGEPNTLPMSLLVLELIEGGHIEDASELVQRIQNRLREPTLLQLVVRLGVAHHKAGAEEVANQHFRMARKIEPKTVGPEIELGQYYRSRKRLFQSACVLHASLAFGRPEHPSTKQSCLATCRLSR